tara:strand:- start:326 stop:517 length:192 start_codon:yes stop_codon:yes gene_type:complete
VAETLTAQAEALTALAEEELTALAEALAVAADTGLSAGVGHAPAGHHAFHAYDGWARAVRWWP